MAHVAMQQRSLGQTEFTASAIGLGCMGFSQGYGTADDDVSVRAIHSAIDVGITLLDTAMSYGRGHNEQLLAHALRSAPSTTRDIQIATKFGIIRDDYGVHIDGRPEHVQGYCDTSLQRLGSDVIDLYYLHRPDPQVPIGETVAAMSELVTAGKVRHIGVSEVTAQQLEEAASVHPIAAVQFEWSMLWREPEHELIPMARQLGIGLVPYSPLGRGLLTATLDRATVEESDFRRTDPRFQNDNLDLNLLQVAALRKIARELDITAGQLALAWLLAQGDDVVPIPGSRHASRVAENAAASAVRLSADDLAKLNSAVPPGAWVGDRQSFAVPLTKRSQPPLTSTGTIR